MKTVLAYRLGYDDYVTYHLPSKRESIRNSEATWAKVFDFRERREVEGGLPIAWQRVEQYSQ